MDEVVKALRTHLTKAAENELRISKFHSKLGSHFHGLASDGIESDCNERVAQLHDDLATAHADAGQGHIDACQELAECSDGDKLVRSTTDTGLVNPWSHGKEDIPNPWASTRDFSKLEPTAVRGVMPTLVNRTGGAPLPTPDLDNDTAVLDAFKR